MSWSGCWDYKRKDGRFEKFGFVWDEYMKVKLEDVCIRDSSNLKQSDVLGKDGEYPIYGAAGYIGNVEFYHQEKSYVAVVKDGAGIGRTSLCPAKSSIIGTMQYLIPKENILPEYLYYVVRYMHLEKYYTGATIPHIYFKDYKNEKFNLDSIDRQFKIINILGKCEKIINVRQKEIEKLDNLVKARFVEMFNETNANWEEVTIADICKDMRTGPFGSALHHDEFVDEGIFVLGIDNAVENKFSYNRMRYITEEKYEKLKRYTVHPGDVIITIMGTVGRSAVIPEDMPKAINTKHLACLTPDTNIVDSYFLVNVFQVHPLIRKQLESQSKGAIMNGLNLTIIKGLKFRLPPLELQKKFVIFYNQINKSKVKVQKALDETQKLFDSLMQQYFG